MDLRIALRSLGKNPGFTALVAMVLALGIGANTAIFSVVNAVLLRPLEYRDPGRIVTLTSSWKNGAGYDAIDRQISFLDLEDWRQQSSAFDAMAFYDTGEVPVSLGSSADYVRAAEVSPEFFRVFQLTPVIGAPAVGAAMISSAYWQAHFGGSPSAIGRTIRVFGQAMPIAGVLPAGFAFPDGADVWVGTDAAAQLAQYREMLKSDPAKEALLRGGLNFQAIGRLKSGVSLEQAQSQMTSIAARLEQQYPETNKNRTVAVTRLRSDMVRDVRTMLYLLLGAAGLILLIACANTATLLLARAGARTREIAVRAAVGASRIRIVRQLIVESLLLALLGGGLGLILAAWGSAALVSLAPADVPRLAETGIDRWVLVFTLAVSAIATVLSGLAPALEASRVDLNDALKQSAARSAVSGKTGRLRAALVIAEVALSVMLVCGAGLLIKSFTALHSTALGYRPDNVLVMRTTAAMPHEQANAFFEGLLGDVAALPGVAAAGATMGTPGHVESSGAYWVGRIPEKLDRDSGTPVVLSVIAPGTFAALGVPFRSGRDFNAGDKAGAPMVAIVNESVARRSFPAGDAVGHAIFCPYDSLNFQLLTIVGVVGDVRQYGPERAPMPECFLPYQQHLYNSSTLSVVVRTAENPESLAPALRRLVRGRSAEVPVSFTTLQASLSESVAAPRFRTLLLALFAGLALILAMAGVYGVTSYMAGQRASEIGLRTALGASPAQVMRMMLRQGLSLAGAGLLAGLICAAAAARLLTSMLFEVKPGDPLVYVAVAVLLGAVALAASYIPARRASKIDPLAAIRQE